MRLAGSGLEFNGVLGQHMLEMRLFVARIDADGGDRIRIHKTTAQSINTRVQQKLDLSLPTQASADSLTASYDPTS
jgi:hypothetical protein